MITELRPYQSEALQSIRETVTQDRVRELLHYDPESGFFTWRVTRNGFVQAGRRAGCPQSDGYIQITIDGVAYYAHCLAWLYVYGKFPDFELDHKNVKNDDNRLDNLREATPTQNCRNKRLRRDNKLGVKGVHQRENGKYRASIRVNGKLQCLGSFEKLEDAAAAYRDAAKRIFGEFARVD